MRHKPRKVPRKAEFDSQVPSHCGHSTVTTPKSGTEEFSAWFTKWLYPPSLGWERETRESDPADVAAASRVRVLVRDDPNLVPLETLPGRNHYVFPPDEEPPWRWRVPGLYPGWSS